MSDAGTWARFRVGGLDDEDGNATQPVQVVCTECREVSPYFTYRDDGGADRTAPLDDLITWVQHHSCYLELHATVGVDIPGRGWLHIVSGASEVDPDTLVGRQILLNGKPVRVRGVETFAVGRPYPPGLPFGLLVEY